MCRTAEKGGEALMKLKNLSNIKWIGGKHGKEERYMELMPEHKIFVDCFAGSCALDFYKQVVDPANITVVNDKNDKLINYLQVLQGNKDELYRCCAALPYSERLYEKYKWEPEPEDDIERAVRFFYIMRLTFSGGGHKHKNGLGLSKTQNKAKTYRNSVELMHMMEQLIKEWHILCRDFEEVIDFYDTKQTFFFLDPPYVGNEDIYAGGFTKEDHLRLRKRLDTIKGKAMVCYYSDPLIDELYSDWHKVEYETASQIQVRDDGEKCPVRTELILMNYKPNYFEQLSII